MEASLPLDVGSMGQEDMPFQSPCPLLQTMPQVENNGSLCQRGPKPASKSYAGCFSRPIPEGRLHRQAHIPTPRGVQGAAVFSGCGWLGCVGCSVYPHTWARGTRIEPGMGCERRSWLSTSHHVLAQNPRSLRNILNVAFWVVTKVYLSRKEDAFYLAV